MKKYLILAALFVAIASYGGIASSAHAEALTPEQRTGLQLSLAVLKAKLINLEVQQGMVPQGDNTLASVNAIATPVTPSITLSASDVALLKTALASLATTLTNLQLKVAQNPQLLASNETGVMSALQGINATLVAIGMGIQNGSIAIAPPQSGEVSGSRGIAQTSPAAQTPSQPAQLASPSFTATALTENTNALPATQNSAGAAANAAPKTAQASSAFSLGKLNLPLIIVIILVVVAIAIWLFWDTEEGKTPAVKTILTAPQKPMQPFTMANSQATQMKTDTPETGQTPLSATIAGQQRKSA